MFFVFLDDISEAWLLSIKMGCTQRNICCVFQVRVNRCNTFSNILSLVSDWSQLIQVLQWCSICSLNWHLLLCNGSHVKLSSLQLVIIVTWKFTFTCYIILNINNFSQSFKRVQTLLKHWCHRLWFVYLLNNNCLVFDLGVLHMFYFLN